MKKLKFIQILGVFLLCVSCEFSFLTLRVEQKNALIMKEIQTEEVMETWENTTEQNTEKITEPVTEFTAQKPQKISTPTAAQQTNKKPSKSSNKSSKPSNFGSFKSYTDYRCLSRSSAQWKLQEKAYTDENGLRRIGNAYLVALGSYYGTKLGTRYIVTLESGNTFEIILGDCKMDIHTDNTHRYTIANGCVIEFYVETEKMPKKVRQMGSIGAIEFFKGNIKSIEKTA